MERAVAVLNGDDSGALDGGPGVQIGESKFGAAAVHINGGGKGLIQGRQTHSATVKDPCLDGVQPLGNPGQVGHELIVARRNPGHLFVAIGHHIFVREVRSGGVEAATLAPLKQGIVDGFAALGWFTIKDVNGDAVPGQASDGAIF